METWDEDENDARDEIKSTIAEKFRTSVLGFAVIFMTIFIIGLLILAEENKAPEWDIAGQGDVTRIVEQ